MNERNISQYPYSVQWQRPRLGDKPDDWTKAENPNMRLAPDNQPHAQFSGYNPYNERGYLRNPYDDTSRDQESLYSKQDRTSKDAARRHRLLAVADQGDASLWRERYLYKYYADNSRAMIEELSRCSKRILESCDVRLNRGPFIQLVSKVNGFLGRFCGLVNSSHPPQWVRAGAHTAGVMLYYYCFYQEFDAKARGEPSYYGAGVPELTTMLNHMQSEAVRVGVHIDWTELEQVHDNIEAHDRLMRASDTLEDELMVMKEKVRAGPRGASYHSYGPSPRDTLIPLPVLDLLENMIGLLYAWCPPDWVVVNTNFPRILCDWFRYSKKFTLGMAPERWVLVKHRIKHILEFFRGSDLIRDKFKDIEQLDDVSEWDVADRHDPSVDGDESGSDQYDSENRDYDPYSMSVEVTPARQRACALFAIQWQNFSTNYDDKSLSMSFFLLGNLKTLAWIVPSLWRESHRGPGIVTVCLRREYWPVTALMKKFDASITVEYSFVGSQNLTQTTVGSLDSPLSCGFSMTNPTRLHPVAAWVSPWHLTSG